MITLVRSHEGDWIAVYKDGKLLDQTHSFDSDRLLTLLGVEHNQFFADPEPTGFQFPDNIEDVVQ